MDDYTLFQYLLLIILFDFTVSCFSCETYWDKNASGLDARGFNYKIAWGGNDTCWYTRMKTGVKQCTLWSNSIA